MSNRLLKQFEKHLAAAGIFLEPQETPGQKKIGTVGEYRGPVFVLRAPDRYVQTDIGTVGRTAAKLGDICIWFPSFEFTRLEKEHIGWVAYDTGRKFLLIESLDWGLLRIYSGVPESTYKVLVRLEQPAAYIQTDIVGVYTYKEVFKIEKSQ